jgi:hypothetical protein
MLQLKSFSGICSHRADLLPLGDTFAKRLLPSLRKASSFSEKRPRPWLLSGYIALNVRLGEPRATSPSQDDTPCRFSTLCLLHKRMQRLDRGLAVLHGNEQTD